MKNNTEELALQSINNYHNITAIKTIWNSFKGRQTICTIWGTKKKPSYLWSPDLKIDVSAMYLRNDGLFHK